jgi:hypothetical protein
MEKLLLIPALAVVAANALIQSESFVATTELVSRFF